MGFNKAWEWSLSHDFNLCFKYVTVVFLEIDTVLDINCGWQYSSQNKKEETIYNIIYNDKAAF